MRQINSVAIKDEADIGAARRRVHQYARALGFDATELAEIDIVVQEIGTNAARYATNGGLLYFTTPHYFADTISNDVSGIELFYCDKGPGIYNVARAVRDGVSTSGSLGAGFGAIRRLTDDFDLYSTVQSTVRRSTADLRRTSHGTALVVRKWRRHNRFLDAAAVLGAAQRVGVWSRPHPHEAVNGDAYLVLPRDERTLLAIIDGLGHGSGAKEAADIALAVLAQWEGEPLDEVVYAVHNALRATRGAVMSVAIIDRWAERLHYAGVGNIAVHIFGAHQSAKPISSNGTLGLRLSKVRVWSHAWAEGATIVMASDGVSGAWDMDSYPGLLNHSPQLLAGILLRDYGRDNDDATILVSK